jgi:hypothetical protein
VMRGWVVAAVHQLASGHTVVVRLMPVTRNYLAVRSNIMSGPISGPSATPVAKDASSSVARLLQDDVFELVGELDGRAEPCPELGQLLERPTGIEPA